jgi:uncharacterized protein GlcG (DUF336 family)
VPVAVCVIDIHGNVVLTHRMGGARLSPRDRRAEGTSALVRCGRRPQPLVQPGQPSIPHHARRREYTAMGGGVPLPRVVVAGVGVSGGRSTRMSSSAAMIIRALRSVARSSSSRRLADT